MVKSYICVLLCLHVVCGAVRRQVVLPGGGPISTQLGGHCDVICNEETHTGFSVCASDGKFYTTQCDYSNAQCKARQNGDTLSIVSYGACVTVETDCDVALHTRCTPSGVNVLSGTSDGPEQLCGSNNRTYDSACSFRVAQCQQQNRSPDTPLTLAHTGKCIVDTSNSLMVDCSKYTVDNSGLAIEGGSTGLLMSQACPRLYKPICMDGRTFSNECSLCHFKVITHALTADNLVTYAAHEGRCTSVDIFG